MYNLVREDVETLGTLAYDFGDIGTLALRHLKAIVRFDKEWLKELRDPECQKSRPILCNFGWKGVSRHVCGVR